MMTRRARVIPFPISRRRRDDAAGGQTPPPAEPPADATLVEACRCRDQGEALVVRGLLESEGVPVILRGHLVQSLHPFSVGDQGEVIVLVPAGLLARARAVLDARPPGPDQP